jgi:thioredoxin reductase
MDPPDSSLTPLVFAVGDVRGGKRVASAVGKGSSAVAFVHQALQQSAEEKT